MGACFFVEGDLAFKENQKECPCHFEGQIQYMGHIADPEVFQLFPV